MWKTKKKKNSGNEKMFIFNFLFEMNLFCV
jgi:hypothetical protein